MLSYRLFIAENEELQKRVFSFLSFLENFGGGGGEREFAKKQ